jgi:hypothetical protein
MLVAGAVLALAGLLALFEHVVAEAVLHGESRRTAVAAQVEAVWRCKLRHDLAERQKCLVQITGL